MFPFSSPATTKFETFPKTIGSIIEVVNLVIKENLLIQDDQKQIDMSSGLYSSSKFFGSRTKSFLWFVLITILELSSEKFKETGKPFSNLHAANAV